MMETKQEYQQFWSQHRWNRVATGLVALLGFASVGAIVIALLIAFNIFVLNWWSGIRWQLMLNLAVPIAVLSFVAWQLLSTQRYLLRHVAEPVTLDTLLEKSTALVVNVVQELHGGTFRSVPRLQRLEEVRKWLIQEHGKMSHQAALLIASFAIEIHDAGVGLQDELNQLERAVRTAEDGAARETKRAKASQEHLQELDQQVKESKETLDFSTSS